MRDSRDERGHSRLSTDTLRVSAAYRRTIPLRWNLEHHRTGHTFVWASTLILLSLENELASIPGRSIMFSTVRRLLFTCGHRFCENGQIRNSVNSIET